MSFEAEQSGLQQQLHRKNRRIAVGALSVVAVMIGVVSYSPSLYRLFCQVTGFAGTTQQAATALDESQIRDVAIKVRFDASLAKNMPWTFKPKQRELNVRPGEQRLAYYIAHNPTNRPVAGTALFNVTPFKVGRYFVKIDCFCFEQQTLQPGETVEMPVVFYVDPEMLDDTETDEVRELMLSYIFSEQSLPEGSIAQIEAVEPIIENNLRRETVTEPL